MTTLHLNTLLCIAINAKQYRVQGDQGSLLFPQPGDLADTDFPSQAAAVAIPVEVLDLRAKGSVQLMNITINVFSHNLHSYRQWSSSSCQYFMQKYGKVSGIH